jgi:2OG-Fe(II) oxygenase superfamily
MIHDFNQGCLTRFSWRSLDVRSILPGSWQEQILDVAKDSIESTFFPRAVTSRESDPNTGILIRGVDGATLRGCLPWLYDLYTGLFRDLAQIGNPEPVSPAANDRYGAILNVQYGTEMRYVCHVDSNPLAGLLYVTEHPIGTGGELVVANNPKAANIDEVEEDCSVVYPVAGNLLFFDARIFAHYVRPLKATNRLRVVVAMNFYTPSSPESRRPIDLDNNLVTFGT